MISVIIPTFNERENLTELLGRIRTTFNNRKKYYEIIIIDDNSTDGTWEYLQSIKNNFPLKLFKKQGKKGKAYSLYEGFEQANGNIMAMIDADLQYPPEALKQMIKKLKKNDLVIANRKNYYHSIVRKTVSRTFKYLFGKALFGLNTDIQSGLKAFRKEVWETVKFKPRSEWTFDLEFLKRTQDAGFSMVNVDINFYPRNNGETKIQLFRNTWEIGSNALLLKSRKTPPLLISPPKQGSMEGGGVAYEKKRFITHTTLPLDKSAIVTFTNIQKIILLLILIVIAASSALIGPKQTVIGLVGILTSIYFLDVLFNAFLISKSLRSRPEISFTESQLNSINEEELPLYTILCPLYKEAEILPHFVASIESLDYPKNKLEVLLLLEVDDEKTKQVAQNLFLPDYFKIITVPASLPKTKPKACNYGLHLAKGKYVVIYDAEDRPDPLQLKKAYLAFQKFGNKIACFQAKLNYYNSNNNFLTRFFTAEYSLWFGLILTGLQSIDTTLPLGGTSNHFKLETLKKLQGWDPFNVTEDCDLGVRLFKNGYQTAIINSTTLEEANSKVGNWLRQRSRWIKGYIQTYLVHNRDFPQFFKKNKHHSLIFQLVVGGKIAFIMINPFMWATTIAYFVFRATLGPTIEQFFPSVIFYMAAFCLVAGNFLYLYYYMIALVKHEKFDLIKYILAIPIYWAMISAAFWLAFYQLLFKPHYWEKTVHGLHLELEKREIEKEEVRARAAIAMEVRKNKIRTLIASGVGSGGILVGASIVSSFLNFLYNAYLGRKISIEDFGLISLMGSFLLITSVPIGSLSRTVTHQSAFYLGKYDASVKEFWRYFRKKTIKIALIASLVWIALSPMLSRFFNAPSLIPFVIFAPVWLIGTTVAVDGGFLSGNLKFKIAALMVTAEATAKLILAFAFVQMGLTSFVYSALPLSMAVSSLIAWRFASSMNEESKNEDSKNKVIKFPAQFYSSSVLINIATISFLSFDVILVKHFLDPVQAGQYALLSLIGKMIYLVGSFFSQFINPLVSREEGASRNSKLIFYKILFASTLSSFLAYTMIGILGFVTAPILFGSKINTIIYLLPLYGFAMFAFSAASNIITFHQIRGKHLFAIASIMLSIGEIVGIALYHGNLKDVVNVISVVGVANLSTMLFLHFLYDPLVSLTRNAIDFISIFGKLPKEAALNDNRTRVLIFNWRDIKHIWAGGAEVYIHEIAKRLVSKGHQVTLFCGNDGNCPRNEIIDGVRIIRRGGFYTVYFWALLYYLFRFSGDHDVIIDSENGIPFFTPIYSRKPIIGLVHHIHQEVFRNHLKFPLAQTAQFLEARLMPFTYRNKQMITVSKSSKIAMKNIGLGKKEEIEIINPGIETGKFKPGVKTRNPSVIYLGRLKPYKSIDVLIRAMKRVIRKIPNATLIIAGEGESRGSLEKLANNLRIKNAIKFVGKVTEDAKVELLSKSWIMVQPSTVEGWGITAIEANASGTPVIASDVPGLRDSVSNPHSGFLVPWGEPKKFAEKITLIIKDKKLRKELEKNSTEWSKKFSWENSTEKLYKILIAQRDK